MLISGFIASLLRLAMIAFIVFVLKCSKELCIVMVWGITNIVQKCHLQITLLMQNEDFASVLTPDLGGFLLYTSGYDN